MYKIKAKPVDVNKVEWKMDNKIEVLRKKLLYKSWNRGCKETDIILGEFAKNQIENLSESELLSFEVILQHSDHLIYDAAVGKAPVPPEFDPQLFQKIVEFSMRRIHDQI